MLHLGITAVVTALLRALVVTVPAADVDSTETLLRAAAYDRNLEARTPEGFRLGVAFDPEGPASKESAEGFAAAASVLKATGSELAPVWVELVAVNDASQLYRWMKEHHVSALYVPAEMGPKVPSIVSASEAAGVFTIAGSPAAVEDGLVVGVRVSDGSKKLVVNMAAAERCGVDFDAVVRQVAQRVGDAPARGERDQLRDALARYSEAIQAHDLDALRSVWPALKGNEEKRIVASFEMARSHTISFALLRIDNRGDHVSARVRRVDRLVTRDGQEVHAGSVVDISFSKVDDGSWQIDAMANAAPPS